MCNLSIQPPSPRDFPGLLNPPPLWNFQFPPWWGYGYFLEPHIIVLSDIIIIIIIIMMMIIIVIIIIIIIAEPTDWSTMGKQIW